MNELAHILMQPVTAVLSTGMERPLATAAVLLGLGALFSWLSVLALLKLTAKVPFSRARTTSTAPALGGIGITTAAALVAFVYVYLGKGFTPGTFFVSSGVTDPVRLLLGLLAVHLVGVYDDFFDLRAIPKLILQVAAALLVVSGGLTIPELSLVHGGPTLALGVLSVPLSVFWIVAVGNAVNLIDGMDGMAAGVVALAAAAFGLRAYLAGGLSTVFVAALLIGALLGFLVHNRPPARMIMGDGGSLFAGYVLALLPLLQAGELGAAAPAAPAAFALVPLATVLCIPALDTSAAIVRRLARGKAFHAADREHIHHKLQHAGLSVAQALPRVYLWGLLAALIGISGYLIPPPAAVLLQLTFWAAALSYLTYLYRHPAPPAAATRPSLRPLRPTATAFKHTHSATQSRTPTHSHQPNRTHSSTRAHSHQPTRR